MLVRHLENGTSMYINEPKEKAQAVVIWLHGLGSSAENMSILADELHLKHPVKHIFLQAPSRAITINGGMEMPGWYDITGPSILDRQDTDGMNQSTQLLHQAIDAQIKTGFSSEAIFLAGFSQGAAVSLFAGMCYSKPLAGLVVLSGYLPCMECVEFKQPQTLPVFFGAGEFDDLVLPQWSHQSFQYLKTKGYGELILRDYDMEHAICSEELVDLSSWLNERIGIHIQKLEGL